MIDTELDVVSQLLRERSYEEWVCTSHESCS